MNDTFNTKEMLMFKNILKIASITILSIGFSTSSTLASNEQLSSLSHEDRLILSEVYLMNGLVDKANDEIVSLAKEGHPESQYILYNDIKNGLRPNFGWSKEEIKSLIIDSAKNGYLPSIQQRVIEIERIYKTDDELLNDEEWKSLVTLGFDKEDIGFSLSYAKWKIFKEQSTNKDEILMKLEKIADKTYSEDIIMFLGDYYALTEGNVEKSQKWYLKAVRMGSGNAANNLAYSWINVDLFIEQALELSKLAVALDPNPSNLDTLAWIYFKKKNFDDAYSLIKKAYSQDSTNWEIVLHKAAVEKELGLFKDAVNSYMRALDMLNELGQKETIDKHLPDLIKELNDLIEKSHI